MEGVRSDTTGISVTVERMSRVTRLRSLTDHMAATKTNVLVDQFSHEPKRYQKTITLDNGPENKDEGKFKKSLHDDGIQNNSVSQLGKRNS